MSQKLVTIRLGELKIVRIICKHTGCGVVTEIPTEHLPAKFPANDRGHVVCSHCGKSLTEETIPHGPPFTQVARLLHESHRADAKFNIEFVLPAD